QKQGDKDEGSHGFLQISQISTVVIDGIRRTRLDEKIERFGLEYRARLRVDVGRDLLRLFVGERPGRGVGHRVAEEAGQRIRARGAGAVIPRARAPERAGLEIADAQALAAAAVAVHALRGVERLAARGIELVERDLTLDALAAPGFGRVFRYSFRQPAQVGGDGAHLLRLRPGVRRAVFMVHSAPPGRVQAADESPDDAVLHREHPPRTLVVVGKDAGDPDQRHRAFLLPRIEVAIAAGQLRLRVAGSVFGRLFEDSV